MKKFIFGFVLAAALIVVVYLQSVRKADALTQSEEAGYQTGLVESSARLDSLNTQLEQQRQMVDSLAATGIASTATIDSLRAELADQEKRIAELSRAVEQKSKRVATATQSKDKEVLDYYRAEVGKLPADLSDYERRVAITEIRQETADKFSMTVNRLNELRQKYKLEF